MPLFALPDEHIFPDPELARDDGLLALGGDLHPARVLMAYSRGIFPWYSEGQPILWHSPDPRFVLFLSDFKVGRSLRRVLRRQEFSIRVDTAFSEVIAACGQVGHRGEEGTWITPAMAETYSRLHKLGFAHSFEAWQDDTLVGGLYGISLGRIFFGESMFATVSDASKVALVALVRQLLAWDFDLLDSQVHTDHLERFGGVEIPRARYLDLLADRVAEPTRKGPWALDVDLSAGIPCPD